MLKENGSFRLNALPTAGKLLVTAFIVLIGSGYLTALGNLFYQHRLADGRPQLSLDDLKIIFHGGTITVESGGAADAVERMEKSRMAQMIEPGGKMRKNLEKGGAEAVRALEAWLQRGSPEELFDRAGLAQPGDPSARGVISDQCVRCHNPYGEKDDAPYSPDGVVAEFAMVYNYAAPGTAEPAESRPAASGPASGDPGTRYLPPHPLAHLFLITHVHMLSIPVFTLILGGLVLLTGLRPTLKAPLTILPMLILLFDFSGWWLARLFEPFIYVILGAGVVYGLATAAQIFLVFGSLWFGRRRAA